MSDYSDSEKFNKAYEIVSSGDDFEEKCSEIKRFYLALLSNPSFSDSSPELLAKIALEHYEEAEREIEFALVEKFIAERF